MSDPQTQDQDQNRDRDQNHDQNQDPKQGQDQDQEPKQEQKPEQGEEKEAKQEVKSEPPEEEKKEKKEEEKKEEEKKEEKDVKRKEEERRREEDKGSWRDSLYNPRTGAVLGRTAGSWGRILLFYLLFYGFLAGMFALTMWVMLQTLDENVPTYQDRVSSPGLVMRPGAVEMSFNRTDPADYERYTRELHQLLQRYNDSIQDSNELCLVGEFTQQDEQRVKKVCQFKRSALRQCSGLPDHSFGFSEGRPCVIIKMNRVIGLKPNGDPYINCTAKRDTPLQMQYFPSEGRLDKMFFPYYGKKAHAEYVQPLVAVKLLLRKEDFNVEHTVECKVEGSDLRNNDERDKFLGRVTFRIKVSE
ncbi:sodium/potassium-transporting ATPase subunit beta-3-like isoform 1-T2 [Menidia menidia]